MAPDLGQEMTKAARDASEKPSIKAAAARFEAAIRSPHRLVAVAAALSESEDRRQEGDYRLWVSSSLSIAYHLTDHSRVHNSLFEWRYRLHGDCHRT